MREQEFKDRTKQLALRVIRLVDVLPNTPTAADLMEETNQIIAMTVASIKTLRNG